MALVKWGGTGGWRSRADALWEHQAADQGSSNPHDYACTETGRYGFVVGCGLSVPITCFVQPDGSGDYPTIQSAIDDVVDGCTILLADGLYQGDGNRDISFGGKAITVRSESGNPALVVINCQGSEAEPRRGFLFHSDENRNSQLDGVTVTGGYQTYCPGISCIGSRPTITHCILINNQGYNGGGLQASSGAFPLVKDCSFIGNTVTNAGGAVVLNTSQIEMARCWFSDNSAYWGGGAMYFNQAAGEIESCTFVGNSSVHWGGAIHCQNPQTAPLFGYGTFHGNAAPQGGCVYARGGSNAYFDMCIFGFSTEGSAAYCDDDSEVHLYCSDVYGNAGGDYVGCLEFYQGIQGNFRGDPIYCDAPGIDFTIAEDSPCAAENQPMCGRVGAWDVACTIPLQGIGEEAGGGQWGAPSPSSGARRPIRSKVAPRFASPCPRKPRPACRSSTSTVAACAHFTRGWPGRGQSPSNGTVVMTPPGHCQPACTCCACRRRQRRRSAPRFCAGRASPAGRTAGARPAGADHARVRRRRAHTAAPRHSPPPAANNISGLGSGVVRL